jgi:RNA-directed DNA polymerase
VGSFDRISHDWLLANIPMDKVILRKWLKAGFMEEGILYPTDEGTPQGGIISPVLANMALDGLQRLLWEKFHHIDGVRFPKIHLVRYADDFIVTAGNRDLLEHEVLPVIKQFMAERGLELSPDKTHITHIEDGFDFLGQNVRKYNGKLLIKPSQKSQKTFLTKIRGIIKANKTATAGNLIGQLNPVIRGWVGYHQHVVSNRVFSRMDKAIFKAIWQWAKRRHPNKGARWVRRKYFRKHGGRSWVFTGVVKDKAGKSQVVRLIFAEKTPIRRHIKVKAEANPYDPAWEIYFEQRLGVKMVKNLRGRRRLLNLWKAQNGLCPICGQKITKLTGWHSHHIVWKSKGGGDEIANQVLLHPTCHSQVHSHENSGV